MKFSDDRREHRSSAVECADLFIPDFTRARPYQGYEEWTGNEEFMLTLTDELGKRYRNSFEVLVMCKSVF